MMNLSTSVKRLVFLWLLSLALTAKVTSAAEPDQLGSLNRVSVRSELKMVKLYGAGGVAGLDSYQSGMFISDEGHILTVWSTVLDVDEVVAVGSDGSRFAATVVGVDPNLEIAILSTKKPALQFFDWQHSTNASPGERVLALSNLYGIATGNEMASIQKGVVMAVTDLKARRGNFRSVYKGEVYVIDAMTNNPGAAGGALINLRGELIGMLGKELKDSGANIWLNYAIPIQQLSPSIERILSGEAIARNEGRTPADRPLDLSKLGIVLVPNVIAKTPPFVDLVQPGSVAERAGLKTDDLILFLNTVRINSQSALHDELKFIDRSDPVVLLVQRDNQLLEIALGR